VHEEMADEREDEELHDLDKVKHQQGDWVTDSEELVNKFNEVDYHTQDQDPCL
jgi:hypothetical protein